MHHIHTHHIHTHYIHTHHIHTHHIHMHHIHMHHIHMHHIQVHRIILTSMSHNLYIDITYCDMYITCFMYRCHILYTLIYLTVKCMSQTLSLGVTILHPCISHTSYLNHKHHTWIKHHM